MRSVIFKRKIKNAVIRASTETKRKTPMLFLSLSTLVIVLLLFCVVDLVIVSVLSPRGKVLREYNEEKNALVEENRCLEQEIAERMALTVITNRAENKLGMKRTDSVYYVKAVSVAADASITQ